MIKKILKLGGFTNEADFYKKYPTEASFMAEHGHKLKPTTKTLNPYISLFHLGGELSASPSYLSDITEVSDTPIASNLKIGKDKTSGFDMKKLAGLTPEANATTNFLNTTMNTTDDRGFQDTGKSTLNAGVGTTASTFAKAFSVTGEPISAGAIALTAGTLAAFGANKKAKAANKELSQDYGNYYAGLPKMTSANPYKMAMGGDKSLNSFNGASHENGGIKLTEDAEVEGGETSYQDYVFSDSLKVPGKNITFAQATKRLESKYKGRENDPYVMRAKEQALTQYMQQNEMVKAIEERKQAHAQELQEIQMRFGGYKKLLKGGGDKDEEPPFNKETSNIRNQFINQFEDNNILPILRNDGFDRTDVGTDIINNSEVNDIANDRSSNYSPDKKKFKFGNEEVALGLSMLPGLYNTVKGWKPDVTNFQNMTPHLVNLESERENLRREAGKARLIANENIRSIGGGSGTALAALASQSSAINDSKMKGLSDSYQREHLANVSTLNDFLVRNNAINNEEIVANEQNKAMSDSVKSLALADLSNNAQSYMRDKSLTKENRRINDLKLNIINQLFPNYEWGKDPNKDAQMSILFKDAMGGIGVGGLGLLGENGNTTTTVTTNTQTGAKTTRTTTTPTKSKKK